MPDIHPYKNVQDWLTVATFAVRHGRVQKACLCSLEVKGCAGSQKITKVRVRTMIVCLLSDFHTCFFFFFLVFAKANQYSWAYVMVTEVLLGMQWYLGS